MIQVSHLSKKYGEKYAVKDISFTVNEGEILGFLGPNGAGKSTTMNMITGYLSSTSGDISIYGEDILENPQKAKKKIGFLPEQPPLYVDMTVKEYLHFVYEIKGCTLKREDHIKEICDLVKITEVYNRVIGNLSKGYKQRVGLAQALIGNPKVLILDEPTVGLDPKQIVEIRGLIKRLGKNHTVILSSHILSEVQAVCERIIVINKGELVADGTPEELSQQAMGTYRLVARIAGERDAIQRTLGGVAGVKTCKCQGEKERGVFDFAIESQPGVDVRRPLFYALADKRMPMIGLRALDMSLEDIFLQLVEHVDEQAGEQNAKSKKKKK